MTEASNSPATKRDLAAVEQRMDGRMTQLHEDLVEKMRNMQTEVLRFHNWARPADVKTRSYEERLALVEERTRDIERSRFPGHSPEWQVTISATQTQ